MRPRRGRPARSTRPPCGCRRRWPSGWATPKARRSRAPRRSWPAREDVDDLRFALVTLTNRVMAADRVQPGDDDAVAAVLDRLLATLDLAVERLARDDDERGAAALRSIPLVRLFRLGVSLTGKVKRLAADVAPQGPVRRARPASRRARRRDGAGGGDPAPARFTRACSTTRRPTASARSAASPTWRGPPRRWNGRRRPRPSSAAWASRWKTSRRAVPILAQTQTDEAGLDFGVIARTVLVARLLESSDTVPPRSGRAPFRALKPEEVTGVRGPAGPRQGRSGGAARRARARWPRAVAGRRPRRPGGGREGGGRALGRLAGAARARAGAGSLPLALALDARRADKRVDRTRWRLWTASPGVRGVLALHSPRPVRSLTRARGEAQNRATATFVRGLASSLQLLRLLTVGLTLLAAARGDRPPWHRSRSRRPDSPAPDPAPPVPAANNQATDTEVAEHVAQGRRLYLLGRYQEAIAEYRRAYELRADPQFLMDTAEAYRQLGATERALFYYERYLAAAPNAPDREIVEDRITELELVKAPPAVPAPLTNAYSYCEGAAPLSSARRGTARDRRQAAPVWKRWWVWTAVGVAVGAGHHGSRAFEPLDRRRPSRRPTSGIESFTDAPRVSSCGPLRGRAGSGAAGDSRLRAARHRRRVDGGDRVGDPARRRRAERHRSPTPLGGMSQQSYGPGAAGRWCSRPR